MILFNLNSKETKLSQDDKVLIFNDLKSIFQELEHYDNQQLLKIINKLKRKYSSLVLRLDNDNQDNIKSLDKSEVMFSDLELDQMENQSIGNIPCSNVTNDNKFKEQLIELCNQILKDLNSEEDPEFIGYLHNIIVWSNVNSDLTNNDFMMKIEEIKINHQKYNSIEKVVDYKDELINLCNALLSDINDGNLPMGDQYCQQLKEFIYQIFDWVKRTKFTNNSEEYKNTIEKLNIKCEQLYEMSQN